MSGVRLRTTHLFKGLFAAVLVGSTIGAGTAAAITMDRSGTPPAHAAQANTQQVMTIGQSSLSYRFTDHGDLFDLHVTVRDQNDPQDMFQTRIKLKDAQVLNMVLNKDELSPQKQGDRVLFLRDGAALVI